MTDREMLELAAKAAGIQLVWHNFNNIPTLFKGLSSDEAWNPLTDDGDALRLAVWLRLEIEFGSNFVNVGTSGTSDSNKEWHLAREEFGDGPLAATRRAIVRAAAEIGRQMP